MKLDRRTVLSGTAAAFAAPLFTALPGPRRRKAPVAGRFLPGIRAQGPGRQGLSRRRQADDHGQGRADHSRAGPGRLLLGAAGGRGALMARNGAKEWSPPAFYGMGSGSLGLQIGAKVSEIVFIIRTEKGLNAILDHKFKFGAEAGVTLVAVGIGLEGASTSAGGADIVAFGNSAGCSPASRSRLLPRRRQRLERALLRPGRHDQGDRARPRFSNPAPSRSVSTSPSGEAASRRRGP